MSDLSPTIPDNSGYGFILFPQASNYVWVCPETTSWLSRIFSKWKPGFIRKSLLLNDYCAFLQSFIIIVSLPIYKFLKSPKQIMISNLVFEGHTFHLKSVLEVGSSVGHKFSNQHCWPTSVGCTAHHCQTKRLFRALN